MIRRTNRGFLLRHLRKTLPLDGHLPGGYSLRPDYVYLMPTLACNLACPYCFQRGVPALANPLSFAEWEAVIDDLRPLGPAVMVMGGELFQYPRPMDFLRAIKAAGLPLTLITNGIALPHFADELVDLGLDSLIVSLDGPPDVHNAVRGHPRGYELAAEGVRRVLARRGGGRWPTVQAFTAISARSQHHLAGHVADMVRLGVDQVVLNYLIFARAVEARAQAEALRSRFGVEPAATLGNIAGDYADVDPAVVRAQLDQVLAGPHRERVYIDPPGIVNQPERYFSPGAPPVRTRGCASVCRELWILPNGNVMACANIYDVPVGNVRAASPRAIWNAPAFRRFRREINEVGLLPQCRRCTREVVGDLPRRGD